jgi:hypothetical protein
MRIDPAVVAGASDTEAGKGAQVAEVTEPAHEPSPEDVQLAFG